MTLYVDSIREGLDRCLEKDKRVCLVGEDILDPYGGAFKATKGLSTKYPERIHTTPIAEGAIVGITTGLAMRGMLPVAEIMFGDFITLCADQIINSATKFPLMYKNKVKVPIVIRTPVAGARGYGPTHSQSLEKIFFGIPGLRILAPNILCAPGLVLEYAVLKEEHPVLFIEDKGDYSVHLYPDSLQRLEVQEINSNAEYATVTATNYNNDKQPDVLIVSYGGGASIAAKVIDDLVDEEIYCKLIAPIWINDIHHLRNMIDLFPKNVPILLIEQGTYGFGWTSELMALIFEKGMVTSVVKRIAARSDVIPAARHLEAESIVTFEAIKKAIFEVIS